MDPKLMFVLVALMTVLVCLSADADRGQSVSRHEEDQEDTRMKKKGAKPVKKMACKKTRKKIKKQRDQIGTICYKKCFLWFCDYAYCKGDNICCTPGKKGGGCCPFDKPVCLGPYCCGRGYDKICSGPTCCPPHLKCCRDYGCCR